MLPDSLSASATSATSATSASSPPMDSVRPPNRRVLTTEAARRTRIRCQPRPWLSCSLPVPESPRHTDAAAETAGGAPGTLRSLPPAVLANGVAAFLDARAAMSLRSAAASVARDLNAGGAWRCLALRDFPALFPMIAEDARRSWEVTYVSLWRATRVMFAAKPSAWEEYVLQFLDPHAVAASACRAGRDSGSDISAAERKCDGERDAACRGTWRPGEALVLTLAAHPDVVDLTSLVNYACGRHAVHCAALRTGPKELSAALCQQLALAGMPFHHVLLGAAKLFGVPSSSSGGIDNYLYALAGAYCAQNPGFGGGVENAHILLSAILMLNTEMRRERGPPARMTEAQWAAVINEFAAPVWQDAGTYSAFLYRHVGEYPLLWRPRSSVRGWVRLEAPHTRGIWPVRRSMRVWAECAGGVLRWWREQPPAQAQLGKAAGACLSHRPLGAIVLQSRDRSPPPTRDGSPRGWVWSAGHRVEYQRHRRSPSARLEHVSVDGSSAWVLSLASPSAAEWAAALMCGVHGVEMSLRSTQSTR